MQCYCVLLLMRIQAVLSSNLDLVADCQTLLAVLTYVSDSQIAYT